MQLYPAIDLRAGRCVRLYQGDYERESVYGDDPVAQAQAFERDGAGWIHVVDLDAARTGEPRNRAAIAAIAAAVDVPLQVGGGVRSMRDADELREAGVARMVVGTVAVEDPGLVRAMAARHPVAVGIDARDGEVAVRGWRQRSGIAVLDAVDRFADAGVAAVVVTDIGRDGTLEGPDVSGLAAVVGHSPLEVVASGGVGSLDDLRALAAVEAGGRRLAGAIVGRALYEGAFTLPAARGAVDGVGHGR